jgi:hypothetical protein
LRDLLSAVTDLMSAQFVQIKYYARYDHNGMQEKEASLLVSVR